MSFRFRLLVLPLLILAACSTFRPTTVQPSARPASAAGVEAAQIREGLDALREMGDPQAMLPLARRLLELSEQEFGPDHPETARAMDGLAEILDGSGNAEAAGKLYERSLKVREKSLGPEHPEVATSLGNVGWVRAVAGKYEEARTLFDRALAIRVKTFGQEALETAESLSDIGWVLGQLADYAEARERYERVLAIREKVLGPENPQVAAALGSLGALRVQVGDAAGARPYLERALAIREKALGGDHPDLAPSLIGLGRVLQADGDYAGAQDLYERALAVRERAFGGDNPDVARSLDHVALVRVARGDFAGAKPLYERALSIREKALGPEHLEVALSLNNLAGLLWEKGEYAAARPLYERALAIRERGLGPEHPDIAVALHNLASVFKGLSDYETARRLDERALRILEKALGPDHDDVAAILASLGELHIERGDLSTARRLLERVLRIREKVLGPEHPHLAFSLNNLGVLLVEQGDYTAALPLFLRSLGILEKQHGPGHPDLADPLNNLAHIADALGDHASARTRYERALEIRRRALGESSPGTAVSLANLASILAKQGDLSTARGLLEQALSLQERALGREHSAVADTLENLAEVRLRQGDIRSAEALAERAFSVAQRALGPDHPQVARILRALAALDLRGGRPDRARERLLQAARIVDRHVQQVFPDLSFAEQRAFLAAQIPEQTASLLAACSISACDPADFYPPLLRWKGLLVESLRRQRLTARLAADPRLAPRADRLREARARLAALHQQAGALPRDEWQARYAASTAQKEQMERELAGELPAAAREDPVGPSPLASLKGAIRPGEALVDIYLHRDKAAGRPGAEHFTALITASDGEVRRLDLGGAEVLRAAVRGWRHEVRERAPAEDAWHELARLVWSPIAAMSSGLSRIWVSPDGELARIPWQLLPETDPRTAGVLVVQLDSPRELVLLRRTREPRSNGPWLLMGGIEFGSPSPGERKRFAQLPWTQAEIDALAGLATRYGVETTILAGGQATREAVLDHLPRARGVHLATHGFFEDVSRRAVPEGTGPGRNPLAESGLAFAGANRIDPSTGQALGILSADDIVGLDLERCEILVLSACETGLGEEVAGQGILGLRSALLAAGGRTVLTSLWDVPDETAITHLMGLFYERLWREPSARVEALLGAQRALRDEPGGRFADPLYWAGWTLAGEGW